jgi:hypothetical protein
LRIGVREGVAFDECRTERRSEAKKQKWELPETREELITRYSSRFRGSQKSFLPSPFPAYKLDAAELLLSRLSKLLASALHVLQAHTVQSEYKRGKRGKSVQRSREEGEPVSFTWEEEEEYRCKREDIFVVSEGTRPSEEVETPKPFNMWKGQELSIEVFSYGQKTQKTTGIMNEIGANITQLLSPLMRVFQSYQVDFLLSLSSISQRSRSLSLLLSILTSLLRKHTSPFFTHELFHIPLSQYQSYQEMIIGVNGLVNGVAKAVKAVGLRKVKEVVRRRRLGEAVGRVWRVAGKRVKEQFNRLRFFGEVLGDFRERERRRLLVRRSLIKLFHFLSIRLQSAQQAGLLSLWRYLRHKPRTAPSETPAAQQAGREEERRKAMGSLVAVIRRNMEFREKTAVVVWRNKGKTSAPASDRHLASLLLSLSAKFSLRFSLSIWRFPKSPPYPLFTVLSTLILSRFLFSWTRIAVFRRENAGISPKLTFKTQAFMRILRRIDKGKNVETVRKWGKQRRKRAEIERFAGLKIGKTIQKRQILLIRSTFYRLVCLKGRSIEKSD